ncbi:hypothetical protein PM082_024877 [Marasmius tenuissimus]|nr:hypothetical protein PM082_024877 [Marasmius tenuissimus]
MHFDLLKLKSLKIFEEQGVQESYRSRHPFDNALRNGKQKQVLRQKSLHVADEKIEKHNKRIAEGNRKLEAAKLKVSEAVQGINRSTANSPDVYQRLERAQEAQAKLQRSFESQVAIGRGLLKSGTGKVGILLP